MSGQRFMIDSSRPVLVEASLMWLMRGCVDELGDRVERKVAALELRIGVEHDRNIDRVGDGAEVGLDLRVLEREIGFQDGEDAVGAEPLIVLRLRHRVGGGGRGNAGDHRHALLRRLDGRLHDGGALLVVEIGKLAGRAERGEPMHAGLDQIVAELAEHIGLDAARRVDGRDEIGKDAVEVGHSDVNPRSP